VGEGGRGSGCGGPGIGVSSRGSISHSYPRPPDPNCINLTLWQIVKLMQFERRASFLTRAVGVADAHPIKEE